MCEHPILNGLIMHAYQLEQLVFFFVQLHIFGRQNISLFKQGLPIYI